MNDLLGNVIVAANTAVEAGVMDDATAAEMTEAVAALLGLTMDDYFISLPGFAQG